MSCFFQLYLETIFIPAVAPIVMVQMIKSDDVFNLLHDVVSALDPSDLNSGLLRSCGPTVEPQTPTDKAIGCRDYICPRSGATKMALFLISIITFDLPHPPQPVQKSVYGTPIKHNLVKLLKQASLLRDLPQFNYLCSWRERRPERAARLLLL